MLKPLIQKSIIHYKSVHSYTQETHILIHILKYSSAFIVLGVRLTKYQQIHIDIPPAAQQMLTFFLHIYWNPYSTFNKSVILSTIGGVGGWI